MHTPGPWTRDDDEIGFEFTVGSGDKCFQAIATIHEPSFYHTTDGIMAKEANARLIAAAPDLLASLHEMTTLALRVILDTPKLYPKADAIFRRANIALDKATGKDS